MAQDIGKAQVDILEMRGSLTAILTPEAVDHLAASCAKDAPPAAPTAELAELSAAIETLAAAVNILATGQSAPAGSALHSAAGEPAVASSSVGQGFAAAKLWHGGAGSSSSSSSSSIAGSHSQGPSGRASDGNGHGRHQGHACGPALQHLRRLLGRQGLQRKMDFFNPDILVQMVRVIIAASAAF
jgi:hypothetical protein